MANVVGKGPWKVQVSWQDTREPMALLRFTTKRAAMGRMAVLANTHGAVAQTMFLGRD